MQVPHYIESFDPGFREFSAEDFSEPIETAAEQLLRKNLNSAIIAEFSRLELEPENWEYLIYSKLGVAKLDNCYSLFAIQEFLQWLQRLESRRIEDAI
jgi:hypothetical protein